LINNWHSSQQQISRGVRLDQAVGTYLRSIDDGGTNYVDTHHGKGRWLRPQISNGITMTKILFWNTAGAGTGAQGEELPPTLMALASRTQPKPDCVVVCEMRKINAQLKQDFRFGDYVYVKPTRPQNTPLQQWAFYKDNDAKRLYVYAQNPAGVNVRLITAGATRPVVCLTINARNILAVHLPSVSSTSKPQAEELKDVYNEAINLGIQPHAFFGDFNVDLKSTARTRSLGNNLTAHALAGWHVVNTGAATHKGHSELDWAFCAPGFNPAILAVNPNEQQKRKTNQRFTDEDMEWDGGDENVTKDSDHIALVLSW